MTYDGIDTAARISAAQAAKLRANGVSFVARYIGPESWGKTITAEEIKILRDAGLAIMLCFESTANRMKGGARAGAEDAVTARNCAAALDVPAGTVIFFACDYDAPASDYASIEAYLRAAAMNVEQYGVGLYGEERTVSAMSERGACFYFWQCVAWSNQFLPVADVRQYAWQGDTRAKAMAAACGIYAVDLDSAETLAGMWLPPVKPAPEPWYADTVRWAEKEGVISPVSSIEEARPEDPATRAEVMQMIRNYNRRFEEPDEKKRQRDADVKEAIEMKDWKKFIVAALIRAVRTLAQTAVATIGTTALITEVDWRVVASASAMAAVLSILTSIATGLPEVDAAADKGAHER